MDLIRKHLMIEGHIEKECLVRILNEVSDVYRKFIGSNLGFKVSELAMKMATGALYS